MSEKQIDHSPIDIGCGSFDAAKLQKATDAAAAAPADKRAEILKKGLDEARAGGNAPRDNAAQPGFETRPVEREIAPGIVVKENISVYVGGEKAEEKASPPVTSKAGAASSAAAEKGSN